MKKNVGSILLPKNGTTLRYYVFGSRKKGFGVQIMRCYGEQVVQSEISSHLTYDWPSARDFAHSLARGAVFPDSLKEICEDYRFGMSIAD